MRIKFVCDRYCGVAQGDVRRLASDAGIKPPDSDYDAVVIIGGDGSFLNHALDYKKPLLPVEGVHKGHLKSVGMLTEHKFSDLPAVLHKLSKGQFKVVPEPVLELRHSGNIHRSIGDFYVERIDTKEAVRYKAVITDGANKTVSYAISNGFIITTPIGSTGYFSYPDVLEHRRPKRINGLGFAHILPSTVKDMVNGRNVPYMVRRTFSINSKIDIYLERNTAYLFGIPKRNSGIRLSDGHISARAIEGGLKKIIV
ncbi:MAG: hypothetical protein ACP5MZ_00510 [Candidatus Micrarchaeia archaeon]